MHCNLYQIGLTWTLFVTLLGDGNDGWCSATFKIKPELQKYPLKMIFLMMFLIIYLVTFFFSCSKSGKMVCCVVFVASFDFYFVNECVEDV